MGAFAVPKVHQHRVLLFGILIALVLRGGFILAGAAVIARFSWVFYLFGAFLVLTAIKVVVTERRGRRSSARTSRCAWCAGCCR